MSGTCSQHVTVRDLIEKYPALAAPPKTDLGINELLAECGYRLVDAKDISRAQTSASEDIQAFFPCQVVKIICCL